MNFTIRPIQAFHLPDNESGSRRLAKPDQIDLTFVQLIVTVQDPGHHAGIRSDPVIRHANQLSVANRLEAILLQHMGIGVPQTKQYDSISTQRAIHVSRQSEQVLLIFVTRSLRQDFLSKEDKSCGHMR